MGNLTGSDVGTREVLGVIGAVLLLVVALWPRRKGPK